jgi:hypothetical protein
VPHSTSRHLILTRRNQIKRRKPGGAESEKVFNPGDVIEQSRSRTLLSFTDDWEVLAKESLSLFVAMLIPPNEVSSSTLTIRPAPIDPVHTNDTQVRGVGLFVDKLDTEEGDASKSQPGAVAALDRYFQAGKASKPARDLLPLQDTDPEAVSGGQETADHDSGERRSEEVAKVEDEENVTGVEHGRSEAAKRKSLDASTQGASAEPATDPQPKRTKPTPAKSPGTPSTLPHRPSPDLAWADGDLLIRAQG